jgi:hypothetical protein
MHDEINIVYRATSVGQADVIVAWLQEQGINALVVNRDEVGTLNVPVLFGTHGVEIGVTDAAQAERATVLLRDHYQHAPASSSAPGSGPTVEAVCEECGEKAVFPYAQRGTVQDCPHCGEFVDVPGGEALEVPEGNPDDGYEGEFDTPGDTEPEREED